MRFYRAFDLSAAHCYHQIISK